MELHICKVISLIVLFVCSFVSAFLPLKIRKISKLFRNDKRDTITTVIQCFGGGLLLGTALILVLTEVQLELYKSYAPLAEVLLAAGFFGIYLIRELASFISYSESPLSVFSEDQDENENIEQNESKNETRESESGIDTVDEPQTPENPPKFNDISLDAITSTPEEPTNENSFSSFNPKYAGSLNTSTQSMFPNYRPNVEASKVQRSTLKHNFQLPKISLKSPSKKNSDKTDSGQSFKVPKREAVAITLLSLNALFKGLVIGLGTSQVNLWQLFSVLLTQQILMSTNLGLEMTQRKSNLQLNTFLILLFSLSISIGVAIGIGITATESKLDLLIVKGVACGVFLYEVIVDVIHIEKCRNHVSGLLQFGALLFGFIVTVLIKILTGDETSDETQDFNFTNATELPPPVIG